MIVLHLFKVLQENRRKMKLDLKVLRIKQGMD